MKITQLGKELRKIRIGKEEVLFDMASKLGISSAMLSAIETGAKAAPEDFCQRLADHYPEIADKRASFDHLCEMTKKVLKVSLDLPEQTKCTVLAFNRVLPFLSDEDLKSLTAMIEKHTNKGIHDDQNKGPDM